MAEGRRRRVLIAGGLGYVGSRLASALSSEALVIVTSRMLSAEREAWLKEHSHITRVEFDSGSQDQLPVEGGVDCIVNLATPSASEATRDESAALELGLRTVRACLELAKRSRADLIHFSTFHVYGAHKRERFSEDDPASPTNAYGRVHERCEQAAFGVVLDGPAWIVRPTNIVGAPAHADLGPQSSLIFLDLCQQAAKDHRLSLRTNGRAYRDFVSMSDAIRAVEILLNHEKSGPTRSGRVLNLSSGKAMRLDELARSIQHESGKAIGAEVSAEFGDGIDFFSEPFEVANERLRATGWEPHGSIKGDIRDTIGFFGDQGAR